MMTSSIRNVQAIWSQGGNPTGSNLGPPGTGYGTQSAIRWPSGGLPKKKPPLGLETLSPTTNAALCTQTHPYPGTHAQTLNTHLQQPILPASDEPNQRHICHGWQQKDAEVVLTVALVSKLRTAGPAGQGTDTPWDCTTTPPPWNPMWFRLQSGIPKGEAGPWVGQALRRVNAGCGWGAALAHSKLHQHHTWQPDANRTKQAAEPKAPPTPSQVATMYTTTWPLASTDKQAWHKGQHLPDRDAGCIA
jgi:hypothetical protein